VTADRRKLTIKIGDETGRGIIAARPFETDADNNEINNFLEVLVTGIREGQRAAAARPDLAVGNGGGVRRYTLYIRDEDADTNRKVYTVAYRDAPPDALEKLSASLTDALVRSCSNKEYVSGVYDEMVAYIKSKGLDGVKITSAQWRDVCACHPLYLTFWDENRKREFEKTSRESINSGIRNGHYKIKQIRMKRVSSRQNTDEKPLIRGKD
jgi:hypothetical protein